jgi:hypothetical protein
MPLELLPMLYEETPCQDIPHQETSRLRMLRCDSVRQQIRLGNAAALIIGVGIALLASSSTMLAQRGGGGGAGAIGPTGGRNAAPVICLYDCPALRDGLSSEDSLKNFRRVMAVQATEEQRAAFARIAKYIQDASDQLRSFRESLQKAPASGLAEGKLSNNATAITPAIEKVLASNHNFLTSFSAAQETGLKETTRKLAIVESDLDRQSKAFDQIVHLAKLDGEQIAGSAANLDKALASFQNEHLALGKEMSIIFPPGGEGLSFHFPLSTNTINVAGETVSIPASGVVSRISSNASSGTPSNASSTVVDNSRNLFHLKLTADLSDLQQNITAILRSQLNRDPRCGERTTIQQASFTPLAADGLVVVDVHYERWVCPPGRESPMEVTSGEGEIEIKLSASVDPKTGLLLVPEISRVTAVGSLRDLLRSGDLGVTLRDAVAAALLSALQKTADLQTALPPAVQQSTTLQKAQFQEAGVDQLSLVLEGQLQLSDAQLAQFTDQLQQRQSAQGAPAPK